MLVNLYVTRIVISFHFISFYLFTAYEDATQLVKDNTTWAIKPDAKGHLIGDKTDVAPKKYKNLLHET